MKKKTSVLIFLAVLLVPILVFVGCAEEEVAEIPEEGESQFVGVLDIDREAGWQIGNPGGRMVLSRFGSPPRTFNDVVAAETSSTDVTSLLYSGPIRRNQFSLEFEPSMAESWEISDDELTVTYTLREGLEWSDGTPITAKDFVFSANQLVLREDIGSNSRSSQIQALTDGSERPLIWEYIDDRTYSVTFHEVTAGILTNSGLPAYPMHIFADVIGWDEDEHGLAYEFDVVTNEDGSESFEEVKPEGVDYSAVTSFWGVDIDVTEVVSSGPWLLGEYVPDQSITLVPNPNYWEDDEEGNDLPYLDEMVYVYVEDQDTELQRFIAGESDAYGMRGEDYGVLVDRQEELGFRIYNVGPASSTEFITFNQNPIEGEDDGGIEEPQLTWLSNKTFRQAMAHLVDRDTIIDNIAFGFGYPQYSFVPRFSPYYWDGADDAAFAYDPDAASDMLDSIDYIDRDGDGFREDPDGNKISLTLSTNSGNQVRESLGELFAQEARNVGIEINFNPIDFNALVGQLTSSFDWELILIGLTGSVDPISGQNVYPSSGNLHMIEPNQENPRRDWERRVDEAWIMANNTTDEDQRKEGFQIIQEIWIEEVPWVYTFNAATMTAVKEQYQNIQPQPIDGFGLIYTAHRIYTVGD
ncbi:MAG: ABC transporter substrate-binding protein [Spirochaetales bacterium]